MLTPVRSAASTRDSNRRRGEIDEGWTCWVLMNPIGETRAGKVSHAERLSPGLPPPGLRNRPVAVRSRPLQVRVTQEHRLHGFTTAVLVSVLTVQQPEGEVLHSRNDGPAPRADPSQGGDPCDPVRDRRAPSWPSR